MPIKLIGEHPWAKDATGIMKSRIGTVFPRRFALVTTATIHAWQRMQFINYLNHGRTLAGEPPLTPEEEAAEMENSVDLILEPEEVLIRPDPANMALAFEADEMLQQVVSKAKIKFLQVHNEQVWQAIKARGECWRISPLPTSVKEMSAMIRGARIGISARQIYYYNRYTGTRILTFQELAKLEELPREELAEILEEITEWSGKNNRHGHPEVDFFGAGAGFGHPDMAAYRWQELSPLEVAQAYRAVKEHFRLAVPVELRSDNPEMPEWRSRMFSNLIGRKNETLAEEILRGLSPEFFLQIDWLPGGRFEEGELIFDSIFEEAEQYPNDPYYAQLCEAKVRGFIFNFIREYGDLEYVNVGRVPRSLSMRDRSNNPVAEGRRDVFIAELKVKGQDRRIVRVIRMQKWGVRERLDEGKSLARAILESEEYTEFVLDRRLGCRRLGMNLPNQITMGRVSEPYRGVNASLAGQVFWPTYFERNYVAGMATDKIHMAKYAQREYARRLARLLGEAAAPNMIVGRMTLENQVVFDDGDEVILEGDDHLPQELLVSDHTGSFVDYHTDMADNAWQYAKAVNIRIPFLAEPEEFAQTYVAAFVERFLAIQQDYRKRQRAFETLFKHCPYDVSGSFAYRWERVLQRLNDTDPHIIGQKIAEHIQLPSPPTCGRSC